MDQLRRVGQYQCSGNTLLGKGFSSNVYKGVDKSNGIPVVFKVIDGAKINNPFMEQLLKSQIRTLEIMDHPYVLSTYTIKRTPQEVLMIIEYCPGGDLLHDVKNKGAYSETEALDVLTQIASGLNYIHSLGILHRDMKSSNILLKQDGTIKITDFGFCEFVKERKTGRRCPNVGSPLYMSPEAYRKSEYSTKSDTWALGVIFYQMLIGTVPFKGLNYDRMVQNVRNGTLIKAVDCSEYSKNILFGLLQVDVNSRWDTTRLLSQLSKFNQCQNKSLCLFNPKNIFNMEFSKQEIVPGCWF